MYTQPVLVQAILLLQDWTVVYTNGVCNNTSHS